jgi:hypothetical protein
LNGEKEMMKKIGLFILVLTIAVTFALPALAYTVEGAKGERFTIGGYVTYDIGYRFTSKEYNTTVSPGYGPVDRTQFFAVLPVSMLNGNFVVGDVSANWAIATSSSLQSSNMQVHPTNYQNQKDMDIIDVFYGTYKFGNSYILAGKIGSTFTTWVTSATLGYSSGTGSHVNSIAFGAFFAPKYPQIRFGQTVSKNLSYYIALVTTGTYIADPTTGATQTNLSYSQLPAIAAKISINFGSSLMVNPGLVYQQVKWDKLPAGWEDTMTSWAVTVPVRMAFGPFVGMFNIAYGQNVGGPAGSVSMSSDGPWTGFQRDSATGKIYNSTNLQGFLDLAYTIGPITPHVFYSITHSENTKWTVGNKFHERTSWGINAFIELSKNFTLIPEFATYSYGTIPGSLNATGGKTEYGNDWLAGVQFRFAF